MRNNVQYTTWGGLRGAFLHPLLDAQYQVNKPVDLHHPALLPADLDLVQQVALRLLLAAAHRQRFTDVVDVLLAGQLGHAWGKQTRMNTYTYCKYLKFKTYWEKAIQNSKDIIIIILVFFHESDWVGLYHP